MDKSNHPCIEFQVVLLPYMMVIHQLFEVRQQLGPPIFASTNYDLKVLPEFHWVLLEFAVFLIVEEIGFFYSHKLAHHPKVRKYYIINVIFS